MNENLTPENFYAIAFFNAIEELPDKPDEAHNQIIKSFTEYTGAAKDSMLTILFQGFVMGMDKASRILACFDTLLAEKDKI